MNLKKNWKGSDE